MDASPIFFSIFAGMAIICSLMVILKKSPVASAFSLILVFFSFAGIYAILGAHMIAALQIVVYAGAIMVLFIFVIMLLNADVPSLDLKKSSPWIRLTAAGMCLALFAVFAMAFISSPKPEKLGSFSNENVIAAGGNVRVVSELMFSEYILPFELTSILLLGAIIGAVAIARRKTGKIGVTNAR